MSTLLSSLLGLSISLTHSIGVTLGVGASTFAIILFLRALKDGTIDASERYLLGAVYGVLRIGMALIALPLFVIGGIWVYQGATNLLLSPVYMLEWTLLAVIVINAVLMTKKKMPMWLGPAIAGGSWYSLFLIVELPLGRYPYPLLLVYYVAFLLIFFAVFTLLRKRYTPLLNTKPTATSASHIQEEAATSDESSVPTAPTADSGETEGK